MNTNKLLKTYDGITGLKTGTTAEAGCCMSATAERDGLSLVAVVLGCKSGTERFKDAASLLDYGFANYTTQKLALPKNARDDVQVEGGMVKTIKVECSDPGDMIVSRMATNKITSELKIKKKIEAPIKKGDRVGEVNYYLDGELLKNIPITAKESVDKMTFSSVLGGLFNSLLEL